MKLCENFYQVIGANITHRFDAAGYLINTKEGLLLIDCGTEEGYEKAIENIEKLGFNPKNIKWILATHGHYDHVGAAWKYRENFGSKIYLHKNDCKRVEKGDGIETTSKILYGVEFHPTEIDVKLDEDQILEFGQIKIETIHTPGHTPGSVCFVYKNEDQTILIAGDTLHGGFSEKIGSSEKDWKKSLKILTKRHFDSYVFGHGGPMLLKDANRRILDAKRSFANYYNPWFKTFKDEYKY